MTAQDDEDRCLVIGKRPPGFRVIKGFVGTEEQQEIERWILSWGEHAWVLEPLTLVSRVREICETLAQRYSK